MRFASGSGLGGSLGGSLTGPLILVGDPTSPTEAATKQYVDTIFNNLDASNLTGSTLSTALFPDFTGDLVKSAGNTTIEIATTGISAGVYSKVTVDSTGRVTGSSSVDPTDLPNFSWVKVINNPTSLAGYGITDGLSLLGGTTTGYVTLTGSITDPLQAVTKQYVDNVTSSVASLVTGDVIRKPYTTTPTEFLKCNGAILSKTAYANLYNVIGDTYSNFMQPGSGKPWRQQYLINDVQDGDITGWTTGTSLPGPLGYSQAIVTKNRVYLLGGYNGSAFVSIVYTAPINADGTLGTWTTGTSLPEILGYSQAIVTKNRVYLLGGHNGTSVTKIYTAPINADGTLGTWVTITPISITSGNFQAIVTKNRVYIMGGWSGSTTAAVKSAPINADGTLGTWATDASLPGPLEWTQAIVTKNRVYLLGGRDGSAFVSIVYTAPINTDGTLGTWTTGTSLLGTLGASQAIVTKNRVHLLGGYIGPYTATVYTTPISGGLNDYSPYYDGTYVPLDVNSFMLPDTSSIDAKESLYRYIKY
jgi:hypothetical protein